MTEIIRQMRPSFKIVTRNRRITLPSDSGIEDGDGVYIEQLEGNLFRMIKVDINKMEEAEKNYKVKIGKGDGNYHETWEEYIYKKAINKEVDIE